mmetsp:Transcript_35121/g.35756  ORF Transcript_35121/g.35756 Transcript_35121/m.35756 type:complete len:91 (-) Transcript_35121:117-389(-)
MDSFVNTLFDLILKPGSSLKLVPAINVALLMLVFVLIGLSWSQIDSIHLIIMGSLAAGLCLSVNWFYYELMKAQRNSNQNNAVQTNQKTD